MSEASAIGNVAELADGQILLPAFVLRRADGLYIDLPAIDARGIFAQFAERVFGAGARFVGLDYELFLNLTFLWEPADIDRCLAALQRKGKPPQLRIARDLVPFPPERRDIYRGVKIDAGGKSAEYLFEQISIEREADDAEAADGSGKRKFMERLHADFDEFVAALWDKGLRYGIDAKAVRDAIARDQAERLTIAAATALVAGKDAGIDEQTDLLHRDDAPRLLPNGRMDLRHYRNRFPQVAAGTRLFKKVPRVAGRSGWDVKGRELLPPAVKDFDIETLAGPGTRLQRDATGEYVVAAMNGFLDIDARSGQISVIDKIVSREGISMRTTGDLSLAGDDFEEHGDVQEKRVVEGHHMTFLADVFGNILSNGGRVTIKHNISGGTVHDANGAIAVEGSASRALLEARDGEVVVSRAESCVIMAGRVRIGRAVSCDIVADEVVIEQAEGCAIAAKNVVLQSCAARKDQATSVTLLLPDLTPFDEQRKSLEAGRDEAAAQAAKLGAALQALTAQPDMKSYLSMQPRIKAKTVVLNPAQQAQWDVLLRRVAPNLRKVADLNEEIKVLRQYLDSVEAELAALAQARTDAALGVACCIAKVAGDTRVHVARPAAGEAPLASLTPKALHKRLHELGGAAVRLFAGSGGSFEWQAPAEK
ncbi:MAG: FapA family protein [Rhodocyclaceae bacterium]|nr:FapA family protein [Rhodocyclaceae bacterium]